MDASDKLLLRDIFGAVSALKPALDANTVAIRSIEERQRRVEISQAEHGVRIDRLDLDVDGLGRKIRAHREASPKEAALPSLGWWASGLGLLVEAPKYWHVLFSLGSIIATAFVVLRTHWPR